TARTQSRGERRRVGHHRDAAGRLLPANPARAPRPPRGGSACPPAAPFARPPARPPRPPVTVIHTALDLLREPLPVQTRGRSNRSGLLPSRLAPRRYCAALARCAARPSECWAGNRGLAST